MPKFLLCHPLMCASCRTVVWVEPVNWENETCVVICRNSQCAYYEAECVVKLDFIEGELPIPQVCVF